MLLGTRTLGNCIKYVYQVKLVNVVNIISYMVDSIDWKITIGSHASDFGRKFFLANCEGVIFGSSKFPSKQK